ncbi:transposase family protein [Nocardiopsis sp. EMB25]|uniref:transposase family protein n=1 Tax=Nocardiopsis sp. EMB25 TaxID=2835867 RepID=UPI002285307D|nr:transposase family protein [Nocardiopsis sp. EMB25]MCY9784561.1 transposase family protein [Nocardiopsis sp. EMB25]
MLFYRAAVPLSRRTLNLAARTIRAHRSKTGSRWRRLDPAAQALLAGVHLYKGEPFAQIAAGFEVGTTTARRYVRETIRLLAQQAPTLEQALRRARRKGSEYVIIDGTLLACDRVAADRPFYLGKYKQHGMNIQIVAAPDGSLLWTSWSLPGAVHDVRAARAWRVAERIAAADLVALADKGYVGLSDVVFCPFKGRGKPQWKNDANSEHARHRSPGESAIAQMKNWRILRKLRCCPQRAGAITRAVLVLQLRETG